MNSFAQSLAGKPCAITAEMCFRRDATITEIVEEARRLAPYVDGIQIIWHPGNRWPVSQLALAAIMLGEGIDPIVHLTCRDRNI